MFTGHCPERSRGAALEQAFDAIAGFRGESGAGNSVCLFDDCPVLADRLAQEQHLPPKTRAEAAHEQMDAHGKTLVPG